MPVIETLNLSKIYSGGTVGLRDLSITVEEGEIFGFLGPNGAGKTTTLLIILGLLEPDAGAARVFGRNYGDDAGVRKRSGVVLDSHGLYETMTLRENLRFFARLYGVSSPETRADSAAEQAGLSDRLDTRLGELSHGLKRRSALARALVNSPDVLFLDEPTTGLDPEAQVGFRELLLKLNRERGTTVFLNSHNLEEVQKLCGKAGVLHKGKLLLCGSLDELRGGGSPAAETGRSRYELTIAETEEAGRTEKLFRSTAGVADVVREGRRLLCTADKGGYLLEAAVEAGIEIESYRRYTDSLEDVYLRIVRTAEGTPGEAG